MPNIPAGVDRIVLSGAMPGGEKWSAGFYQRSGESGTAADTADTMANGASQFFPVVSALRAMNPVQVTISTLTVYRYTGGAGASDTGVASVGASGNGTGANHPNQTAFVTTFRSATPTRSGRGRAYWPALIVPLASTGLAVPATLQALLNAFANYNQLSDNGLKVVSTTQGVVRDVVRIDADLVLDSMNSRRRSLSPTRIVGTSG